LRVDQYIGLLLTAALGDDAAITGIQVLLLSGGDFF